MAPTPPYDNKYLSHLINEKNFEIVVPLQNTTLIIRRVYINHKSAVHIPNLAHNSPMSI